MGISSDSLTLVNDYMHYILDKIAREAIKTAAKDKKGKTTFSCKDVQVGIIIYLFIIIILQTAVKTLIKKDLGEHANDEGFKAIQKYRESAFGDDKKKIPIEFNIEK
jgi:hypothetical protein